MCYAMDGDVEFKSAFFPLNSQFIEAVVNYGIGNQQCTHMHQQPNEAFAFPSFFGRTFQRQCPTIALTCFAPDMTWRLLLIHAMPLSKIGRVGIYMASIAAAGPYLMRRPYRVSGRTPAGGYEMYSAVFCSLFIRPENVPSSPCSERGNNVFNVP